MTDSATVASPATLVLLNPPWLERGPVYRFCLNHVVELDDPYEMFPIERITLTAKDTQ